MDTIQHGPKYRKKLNDGQIHLLELLYSFRFATSRQIAKYQATHNLRTVQNRLKILEDQQLIAKQYDSTYKLRGKPASYYLLPSGARILQAHHSTNPDKPINFKRIYRDKRVSESFITHCLHIASIYLNLCGIYPEDKLTFATAADLAYDIYDFLPDTLPDAYIRLDFTENRQQFFLDIFEETQPYFVIIRRIKHYVQYCGNGYWDDKGGHFPIILLTCATRSIEKRLHKQIRRILEEAYDEITFATTTIPEAINGYDQRQAKIWRLVDQYDDDLLDSVAITDLKSSESAS